jgi:lipoyl(octanoyl) transferase
MITSKEMIFIDWGLINYKESLDKQLELVEQVSHELSHPGFLVFCSHPPVVTLGRQTKADDLSTWSGDTVEVSRGGRATYHGPSQLVVYLIMNIKNPRKNRGPQEIRGFLRDFESTIVNTVKTYGIEATGRSEENIDDTGVWIPMGVGQFKKMASIGIAVKKWITYHGAAINLDFDQTAFQGINPCGYSSEKMISLQELLERKIDRTEFKARLKTELSKII